MSARRGAEMKPKDKNSNATTTADKPIFILIAALLQKWGRSAITPFFALQKNGVIGLRPHFSLPQRISVPARQLARQFAKFLFFGTCACRGGSRSEFLILCFVDDAHTAATQLF